MLTNYTNHAAIRSQQRGIPPVISDWLLAYGEEEFNGHGVVVRYFSTTGIRQLEGEIGKKPVQQMSEYLRHYRENHHDIWSFYPQRRSHRR